MPPWGSVSVNKSKVSTARGAILSTSMDLGVSAFVPSATLFITFRTCWNIVHRSERNAIDRWVPIV